MISRLPFIFMMKVSPLILNSQVDIRAAQIEFGGQPGIPNNMTINTGLGQGYYYKADELFRVLLYDRQGLK